MFYSDRKYKTMYCYDVFAIKMIFLWGTLVVLEPYGWFCLLWQNIWFIFVHKIIKTICYGVKALLLFQVMARLLFILEFISLIMAAKVMESPYFRCGSLVQPSGEVVFYDKTLRYTFHCPHFFSEPTRWINFDII